MTEPDKNKRVVLRGEDNPRRSKRGRKTGPRTGPEAIKTAELRAQVLTLRKQGWSYAAIGEALGFTAQRAYAVLTEALNELIKEPTQQMFDLEIERLDSMLTAVFEAAEQGDAKAIEMSLRIMERRAKLLGLDKQSEQAPPSERYAVVQIIGVPAEVKVNGHAHDGADTPVNGHAALNGHPPSR